MDREIREHAKRHPRVYACMLLAMACTFALGGVRAQSYDWYEVAVIAMTGAIVFSVVGAVFLIFGRRCFAWDARLAPKLDAQNVKMKPLAIVLLCGFLVIAASIWLLRLAEEALT